MNTAFEIAARNAATPAKGHNSKAVAEEKLKELVERIETLEEEKRERTEEIRELYISAKANGLDAKVMRRLVAERKRNAAKVAEEEDTLASYRLMLGMLS